MNNKKYKRGILCLNFLFCSLSLSLFCQALKFLTDLEKTHNQLDRVSGCFNLISIILFLLIIDPLIACLEYLYQKNKED